MADAQRIVVTVHTLDGGAEYATPPRLGATLTRLAELRHQREVYLKLGWGQEVVRIEEDICYMQRDRGAA